MKNMKLAKVLKIENKQNTKQILQQFTERWNKAERLIRAQPQEEEVPIPKEVPVPSQVLKLTFVGPGFPRENQHTKGSFS